MTARTRRHRTAGVATAVVAALVLWAAPSTAGADTAAYATWTVGGGAGAFTGTMTVGVPGFPAATFSSNATTASGVGIQSGASTFLSAATPFGAVFGSSLNQPYANIRYATGQGPSTTTFAFAAPTPSAGWGFAVGDVDADTVRISATDAGGNPVPVAALGFEGKMCIHPAQIPVVNEVFSPSEGEVAQARRILDAMEQARRDGRGAVALDGRMLDIVSIRQAEQLLERASAIAARAGASPAA